MIRMAWTTAALSLVAIALVGGTPAASPNFPARIDFPAGWRAEGVAVGRGSTFYAGDTTNGAIYAGDLRTGDGSVLVAGKTGGSAFGVFADYTLTTPTCFINDVTVTNDGAYFTNTNSATSGLSAIFKIPIAPNGELGTTVETIPVPFVGGNGIEATPDGKTLVAVSITTGKLYAIDTATGVSTEIVVDGTLQ